MLVIDDRGLGSIVKFSELNNGDIFQYDNDSPLVKIVDKYQTLYLDLYLDDTFHQYQKLEVNAYNLVGEPYLRHIKPDEIVFKLNTELHIVDNYGY